MGDLFSANCNFETSWFCLGHFLFPLFVLSIFTTASSSVSASKQQADTGSQLTTTTTAAELLKLKGGKGPEEVKKICEVIRSLKKADGKHLFPDDNNFMERMAWVESKFGTDLDATDPYTAGIWQVRKDFSFCGCFNDILY